MDLKSKLLFLILGVVTGFIISGLLFILIYFQSSVNVQVTENNIIDKDWLEGKLFSNYVKRPIYQNTGMDLEKAMFGEIKNIYVNEETEIVEGFDFYSDSAYYGLVVYRYSDNSKAYHGIGGFFVYTVYDSRLRETITPSGQVFIYDNEKQKYLMHSQRKY